MSTTEQALRNELADELVDNANLRERVKDDDALIRDLLSALGPSDGGTASFPDELEVIAGIMDIRDPGSGLGKHLRERAEQIRAAIAKAEGRQS